MKISTYTRQPYPFFYEELEKVFLVLCFLAIASFFFTYLFEPFITNVAEHKVDSLWILALHSVIPIPIAFIYIFFLKKSVKNIENWTLGKEFFHLALIFLLIGLANFLIRDFIYTNLDNWSSRYLWEEIRNTFLVGSLLLIIILPLNLERLINTNLKKLKSLPTNQQNTQESKIIVQIITPIAEEKFDLDIQLFLFAKVDGNYLEIYNRNGKRQEKLLKRLTLKEFEEQLNSFPFIFKVHRSYVVNLKAIENISGNAQGYLLHFKNDSQRSIPVSRSKIDEFNRHYANLGSQ